jgi:hypothetical protein
MKACAIFPSFEMYGEGISDEKTQAAISLISQLAFDCLRSNGDHFQFVVDWHDPGVLPQVAGFTDAIAEPHIVQLLSDQDLLARIRSAVDPNGGGLGGTIRSIATCRALTFGFDGQAFLCLRLEDEMPVSPDATLATVADQPEMLTGTDYFDGWVRA